MADKATELDLLITLKPSKDIVAKRRAEDTEKINKFRKRSKMRTFVEEVLKPMYDGSTDS